MLHALLHPDLMTSVDAVMLNGARILLAAAGLLLTVLLVRRSHLYRRTSEGYLFGAFAGCTLIATLDQLERIGSPVSWRLPAYAIVLTLALVWVGQAYGKRRSP